MLTPIARARPMRSPRLPSRLPPIAAPSISAAVNQANHWPPSFFRVIGAEQTLRHRERGDRHQAQFDAVEHEAEKRGGQHRVAGGLRKFVAVEERCLPPSIRCRLRVTCRLAARSPDTRPRDRAGSQRLRHESGCRSAAAAIRPA